MKHHHTQKNSPFEDHGPIPLTILTSKGLESSLEEETREILESWNENIHGSISVGRGAISFQSSWKAMVILNYTLRTASRVLINIYRGRVGNLDNVYNVAKEIPWEKFFTVNETFALTSAVSESNIRQNLMVNLKIKDAIADRFRELTGKRPSVDRSSPQIGIYAKIHQNYLEISLDTSGESLTHRGNRKISQEAPMRETLAAALLRSAGWHQVVKAIHQGGDELAYFERVKEGENLREGLTRLPRKWPIPAVFYDPMCGSGTLAIEAALMLKGKYPALQRKYFSYLSLLPAKKSGVFAMARTVKAQLVKGEKELQDIRQSCQRYFSHFENNSFPEKCFVYGSDQSQNAIKASLENARAAGVSELCQFEVFPLHEITPPSTFGLLIVNPPYGKRMGDEDEGLFDLYEEMGERWKHHFKGWVAWVLTGNEEAIKKIRLRATRRQPVFNGPLKCQYLQYVLV